MTDIPGHADILAARERIAGRVLRTPLVPCPPLGVSLKLELLQPTGSFKVRGAFNRLLSLTAEERARGVVAVSAGNHAAAVALAGRELGVDVLVLMPTAASAAKVSLARGYGATVDLASPDAADAFARMAAISEREGRVIVHPYDDPLVVAGAGTAGLEIAEQAPDADLVVVPVGGGGLASGIALALATALPRARVVAVSPVACGTLAASLAAGEPTRIASRPTIADALAAPVTGAIAIEVLGRLGAQVVAVDESELAVGFRALYATAKVACEPGAAAAVAAILAGKVDLAGVASVVCVVSGGNVAPAVAAGLLLAEDDPARL
jgi:threonine dehydratase